MAIDEYKNGVWIYPQQHTWVSSGRRKVTTTVTEYDEQGRVVKETVTEETTEPYSYPTYPSYPTITYNASGV